MEVIDAVAGERWPDEQLWSLSFNENWIVLSELPVRYSVVYAADAKAGTAARASVFLKCIARKDV